jgi:rubrerythrin
MATLAGRQADSRRLLSSLVELEFDAIAAYTVAIERLADITLTTAFEGFRADHMRHVRELRSELLRLGFRPPDHADLKAVLTKGKVYMGSLASDRGILMAMRSNEKDTKAAYELALDYDVTSGELAALFQQDLADERRHRRWIEDQLSLLRPARRRPREDQPT